MSVCNNEIKDNLANDVNTSNDEEYYIPSSPSSPFYSYPYQNEHFNFINSSNIIRVGIIIKCDNKFLVVHQNASDLWGFPKGRLKKFESFKEGACRELYEETGIMIDKKTVDTNLAILIKKKQQQHRYYIITVKQEPNVNIDGYEIKEYKWITIEELEKEKVSYFTKQVINRLKSKSLNKLTSQAKNS